MSKIDKNHEKYCHICCTSTKNNESCSNIEHDFNLKNAYTRINKKLKNETIYIWSNYVVGNLITYTQSGYDRLQLTNYQFNTIVGDISGDDNISKERKKKFYTKFFTSVLKCKNGDTMDVESPVCLIKPR
jgi:pyruvate kinase